MKKNIFGENILEPWEQKISDEIKEKIKEDLEKLINEAFENYKGEHRN